VATIARSEDSLRAAIAAPDEARRGPEAVGFAVSAFLHGLVLLWLLIAAPFGSYGSGGVRFVPIDVVFETAPTKTPPPQPQAAAAPALGAAQAQASNPANAPPSPASSPTVAGAGPMQDQPPADALEAKLAALAQLRQPETTQSISAEMPTSDDGAGGRAGPPGLKDFVRAQIERRWNLNLASLGDSDVFVPIEVKITSKGVVLKAEIVPSARVDDPAYREVAVSARNAVLLASPIALPAGQYQDVMEMVLYLNPRDTLH
jgi:hypothetical protein